MNIFLLFFFSLLCFVFRNKRFRFLSLRVTPDHDPRPSAERKIKNGESENICNRETQCSFIRTLCITVLWPVNTPQNNDFISTRPLQEALFLIPDLIQFTHIAFSRVIWYQNKSTDIVKFGLYAIQLSGECWLAENITALRLIGQPGHVIFSRDSGRRGILGIGNAFSVRFILCESVVYSFILI